MKYHDSVLTCMAAGNMVSMRVSLSGLGDALTREERTSRARPFRPDLSSEAFRMERRGGTKRVWKNRHKTGETGKLESGKHENEKQDLQRTSTGGVLREDLEDVLREGRYHWVTVVLQKYGDS